MYSVFFVKKSNKTLLLGISNKKGKFRTVLTYFQVEVRVQLFQLVRHTISLDASQLGQKNTAALDFSLIVLIILEKN